MTAVEFCYWLQGCFELNPDQKTLTEFQTEMIKRHLGMVFIHDIDPKYPNKDRLDLAHTKPPFNPPQKDVLYRC